MDKYLDDAFLSSLTRVRLIHGKGTGTLGEAIQRYLPGIPTSRISAMRSRARGAMVLQ